MKPIVSRPPNHKMSQQEFETVYRELRTVLAARLRGVFGSGPPEAEDLVQEVFAKLAAMPNSKGVHNPGAFLFRAAVNLGLNSKKRFAIAQRYIADSLKNSGDALVEEYSAKDLYTQKARKEAVTKAIMSLPQKQREIVVRSRIKGQTYAEIRAETGWSQADISRQFKAALASLSNMLVDE